MSLIGNGCELCDICGNKININTLFWELETYELDLGDDTCYNYENFDLCSEECVRKKFEEYIIKSKEYKDKPLCFNLNNALIREGF